MKASAHRRPSSHSFCRNLHSALSLEEEPNATIQSLAMRWMRIRAHNALSAFVGQEARRSSAIIRSSLTNGELKEVSFTRFRMSRADLGVPGRWIGLICTKIVSLALHSRTSGVMVGFPA